MFFLSMHFFKPCINSNKTYILLTYICCWFALCPSLFTVQCTPCRCAMVLTTQKLQTSIIYLHSKASNKQYHSGRIPFCFIIPTQPMIRNNIGFWCILFPCFSLKKVKNQHVIYLMHILWHVKMQNMTYSTAVHVFYFQMASNSN